MNHLRLLDACEGKKRRRRVSKLLHFCFNDGDDGVSLRPPLAGSRHHVGVLRAVVFIFIFLHLLTWMKGCDVAVQHLILGQTQVDAGVVQLAVLILILIRFLGRCRRVFRTGLDLSAQAEEVVQNSDPPAGRFCF